MHLGTSYPRLGDNMTLRSLYFEYLSARKETNERQHVTKKITQKKVC